MNMDTVNEYMHIIISHFNANVNKEEHKVKKLHAKENDNEMYDDADVNAIIAFN